MPYPFTLTGHSIVLSADFYLPIELHKENKDGLALLGFYIYNSIFNVDEIKNKFAYMKEGYITEPRQLQIPAGAYQIDKIGKAMLEAW